jgi:hypothetical protein
MAGDEPAPQPMGIAQGLRTFAPGRVSRRFGVNTRESGTGLRPRTPAGPRPDWRSRATTRPTCSATGRSVTANAPRQIPVFRPFEIRPVRPGKDIGDTSNAFLIWHTQIVAMEPGIALTVPDGSPWQGLLETLTCFRHAEHAPIQVRRFAIGSNADIRVQHGEDTERDSTSSTRVSLPPSAMP